MCTERTRAGHALTNATPNHFDFAEDGSSIFFLGSLEASGEQELLRLEAANPDSAFTPLS
jgi:hypothetical protein